LLTYLNGSLPLLSKHKASFTQLLIPNGPPAMRACIPPFALCIPPFASHFSTQGKSAMPVLFKFYFTILCVRCQQGNAILCAFANRVELLIRWATSSLKAKHSTLRALALVRPPHVSTLHGLAINWRAGQVSRLACPCRQAARLRLCLSGSIKSSMQCLWLTCLQLFFPTMTMPGRAPLADLPPVLLPNDDHAR